MNKSGVGKAVLSAFGVLLLGGSFFAGYHTGLNETSEIEKVRDLEYLETDKPAGVDFSPFWKAWNVINEKYVATREGTTTTQDRVWGSIQGLAASLNDPYTNFFPPEENEIFQSTINGTFEGIGMEIDVKDKVLTVVAPLKGTPAYRAGVKPGDKILQIDGVSTADFSTEKAVRMIRGKKGTAVKLLISRDGKEPFELSVVRDTIKLPTIDVEGHDGSGTKVEEDDDGKPLGLREDGIFVIRLYNFSAESPEMFRQALREFVLSGSHKLIIDLRGNPGGYLEAAVDMASWFLPPGKVIVREDFGDKSDVEDDEFRSRGYGNDTFGIFTNELKLVILVDGGSASASEILAGALKENGVATLVGTKTFGKGSVQELVPITADTSLKVTIARWLTPNGVSISEHGIVPDVEVKITDEDIKNKRDPQMDKAVEILRAVQ